MALYKYVYYYYFFKAHQHKAAGSKTRLDIQNYGSNGNLLCYHGVVERNRISSLYSHGRRIIIFLPSAAYAKLIRCGLLLQM